MRLRLDPSASLRMTWLVVRSLSLYVIPSVAPGIRRSVKITAATPRSFGFAQDDVAGCSFTILMRHSERTAKKRRNANNNKKPRERFCPFSGLLSAFARERYFSSRFRVVEPYSGFTVSSAAKAPSTFLKPAIHSPAASSTYTVFAV